MHDFAEARAAETGALPPRRGPAGARAHRRWQSPVRAADRWRGSGGTGSSLRAARDFGRQGPVPGRGPERQDLGATIALMSDGAPTIQIPRWIQLVGLPIAGADRAPDRREGLSRGLPVPGRRIDRAPARPAGARPGTAEDPARLLDCDRLPQLCRRAGRRRARPRRHRDRPVTVGCQSDRRLRYDRERTAPADRGGARRRPSAAVAGHASPRADRHPQAGPGLRREHQGQGRREVHVRGDRLPARRGDLDLPADLQRRARPGRLDLHAPRPARG